MFGLLEVLFNEVGSYVVVNNVRGNFIRLHRSLRQGDIPSMDLFAYGLDPYLERLRASLKGIVVYSRPAPVQGPVLENEPPLPNYLIEERLTAFGYADDVKNAITSLEEFILVDKEHQAVLYTEKDNQIQPIKK